MKRLRAVRFLTGVAGAFALMPMLHAATCSGNTDINGTYAFDAQRLTFWAATTTPPGTTGTSAQIDNLVGGATATAPFGAVGIVQADGNGNLAATTTPGGTVSPAGNYTVNTDCTVTVTLNSSTSTATTPVSATFTGIASQTGNRIDLLESTGGQGTVLTLTRVAQQSGACTNATLAGSYVVALSGNLVNMSGSTVTAGTFDSSTLMPFSVIGSFIADGNGNFTANTNAGLTGFAQITGSYTVNSDCTGTAFVNTNVTTSTGVTESGDVSFVLVSPTASCPSFGRGVIGFGQPEMDFVFTDQGIVGSGVARPE